MRLTCSAKASVEVSSSYFPYYLRNLKGKAARMKDVAKPQN